LCGFLVSGVMAIRKPSPGAWRRSVWYVCTVHVYQTTRRHTSVVLENTWFRCFFGNLMLW
jgi:hypothetical protein